MVTVTLGMGLQPERWLCPAPPQRIFRPRLNCVRAIRRAIRGGQIPPPERDRNDLFVFVSRTKAFHVADLPAEGSELGS